MKARTVVYGLGDIYRNNRERIDALYNVVGYCDRDVSRLPESRGWTREYLAAHPEEYDILLIATVPILVLQDLTANLGIPRERIRVLFYDDVRRQPRYEMHFYGLNREDEAVLLLAGLLGMRMPDVRYIDIGANEPVHDSNSFGLYRLGARGMLVDPLEEIQQLAEWMRPEDRFIAAAVSASSRPGGAVFYASEAEQLGSLHANHHRGFGIEKAHNIRERKVDVIGINDLLEQAGFQPDILLVDAEGEDEAILRGMDYAKYRPPIIMAEVRCGNGCDLETFMAAQGYGIFQRSVGGNTLFAWKDAMDRAGMG